MRALSSREALVSFIFFGAEIDLIYTDVFFFHVRLMRTNELFIFKSFRINRADRESVQFITFPPSPTFRSNLRPFLNV